MKQMEPKPKDQYEPPEVRDIAPVTIGTAYGPSDEEGIDDPKPNAW